MSYGEFLDAAVEAAERASDVINRNLGALSASDVGRKQSADFVTRVDRESEDVIVDSIGARFPGHAFMAEEEHHEGASEFRWIIDPLDGTTNYIHGYPMFSVSIALEHGGDIVIGIVLDVLRNEMFAAVKGEGARLNGKQLSVSSVDASGSTLVTTGFPFRQKHMIDKYLEAFKRVFLEAGDLRRAGSAALDLSHLAAGRCDGFFELGLSAWDMAAGALLITEAGGVVTDFGGGIEYLDTGNIVAGNPATHGKILSIVQDVFSGVADK